MPWHEESHLITVRNARGVRLEQVAAQDVADAPTPPPRPAVSGPMGA